MRRGCEALEERDNLNGQLRICHTSLRRVLGSAMRQDLRSQVFPWRGIEIPDPLTHFKVFFLMVPNGILQLMNDICNLLNYIVATTDMISMHCEVFPLYNYVNLKPSTEDPQTIDRSSFAEYNKSKLLQ